MRTDGFVITCFATGLLTGVFTGIVTGLLTGVLTGIAKSPMCTTKKPNRAYYIAHLLEGADVFGLKLTSISWM